MPELILVVDDEPKIARLARDYLEKYGYRVLTAGDGQSALTTARREKPDIIVLDLMLPNIDGREVCKILRRESDVPIIMLTALAEEVDQITGLEIGADDYITKPFSPRALVARVRALLRRMNSSCFLSSRVIQVKPSPASNFSKTCTEPHPALTAAWTRTSKISAKNLKPNRTTHPSKQSTALAIVSLNINPTFDS